MKSGSEAALAEALKPANQFKPIFKKFKLEGIRRYIAKIRMLMADGRPDWEIAEELGLEWHDYNDLKKEMYRWETADLYDRPVEQQFIDYMIRQEAIIQELDELAKTVPAPQQLGAVKAKSEILDKIIKTGQSMGVLEKAPERRQVVAGVLVANMTNDELRKSIAALLKRTSEVVNKYDGPPKKALLPPERDEALPIVEVEAVETEAVEVEIVQPQFSADNKPDRARNAPARARNARKRHRDKSRVKVT